jgi:hypothetical protein
VDPADVADLTALDAINPTEAPTASEPREMAPVFADGAEADVPEPSGEPTVGPEETNKEAVSPEEFANVHSDFWQEFGRGMLTLPAPAAP